MDKLIAQIIFFFLRTVFFCVAWNHLVAPGNPVEYGQVLVANTLSMLPLFVLVGLLAVVEFNTKE